MSSKQILFFWTSDLALVRFREIDDVPAGPYEALFRPGEWRVVQEVGHLKQLTDVSAVEKAHGIARPCGRHIRGPVERLRR